MRQHDAFRINSLLAILLVAGGSGSARGVRAEMESTHGLAVTLDRVRQDFATLVDLGLATRHEDTVVLTIEGRETAGGLRQLPVQQG